MFHVKHLDRPTEEDQAVEIDTHVANGPLSARLVP